MRASKRNPEAGSLPNFQADLRDRIVWRGGRKPSARYKAWRSPVWTPALATSPIPNRPKGWIWWCAEGRESAPGFGNDVSEPQNRPETRSAQRMLQCGGHDRLQIPSTITAWRGMLGFRSRTLRPISGNWASWRTVAILTWEMRWGPGECRRHVAGPGGVGLGWEGFAASSGKASVHGVEWFGNGGLAAEVRRVGASIGAVGRGGRAWIETGGRSPEIVGTAAGMLQSGGRRPVG